MTAAVDFVTLREVTARYGVTRRQVMAWVNRGEFPAALVLPGRRSVRFRRAEVESWEQTRWLTAGDLTAIQEALWEAPRTGPSSPILPLPQTDES